MTRSQKVVLLVACLWACGQRASDRYRAQMRDALAALAGAEDFYYATNHRYSADPAVTRSLRLAPGVALMIWSADEGGWHASASHDSTFGTCILSATRGGDAPFATLDGPTCRAAPLSESTRDSLARQSTVAGNAVTGTTVLLPAIDPTREEFGYPAQTVDRLAVRRLLIARSFDALDTLLTAYADSVTRDYRLEYRLFDAYGAFDVAIPALEAPLTAWVQERPTSAPALIARATFFVASGWHARGTKWARETQDQQFGKMGEFFRLAIVDLTAAHRLSPAALPTYYELMRMAQDPLTSRKILDKALAIQPHSFLLRALHMHDLEPRWGGSYEAMARFAEESAPYAQHNPRIAALRGFAHYDRGRMLWSQKEHARAIQELQRALQFGDFWQFRYRLGQLYSVLDRPAEALEEFNRALVQRPQDADLLYERADVEYDLGRAGAGDDHYAQGFRDIDLAVELDPTDQQNVDLLGYYRQYLPQFAPPARP